MIKREDFIQHAPKEKGEQINTWHCKTGHNNDRMYVRRNEDDSIVAYCHHCGEHGFCPPNKNIFGYEIEGDTANSSTASNSIDSTAGDVLCTDEFSLPTWYQPVTNAAPDEVWNTIARTTPLSIGTIEATGVGYLEDRVCTLVFPYYTGGMLTAYQTRDYSCVPIPAPKYLTKLHEAYNSGKVYSCDPMYTGPTPVPDVVVLTEDFFSAAALSEFVPAVSLMGVALNDNQLVYLSQLFSKIVVWLDNDNEQVRKASRAIALKLSSVAVPWDRIIHKIEPKQCSTQELRGFLMDKGIIK